MENITKVAKTLGYLDIPENMLIPLEEIHNYSNDKITIITTGSQGRAYGKL